MSASQLGFDGMPAADLGEIRTGRFIGKCVQCGHVYSVVDDTTQAAQLSKVCKCMGHDHWGTIVLLERIVGKVTKGRCNADCMSARGPLCSCSCGGRNHGRGWS